MFTSHVSEAISIIKCEWTLLRTDSKKWRYWNNFRQVQTKITRISYQTHFIHLFVWNLPPYFLTPSWSNCPESMSNPLTISITHLELDQVPESLPQHQTFIDCWWGKSLPGSRGFCTQLKETLLKLVITFNNQSLGHGIQFASIDYIWDDLITNTLSSILLWGWWHPFFASIEL